jgi:hypothetical protein
MPWAISPVMMLEGTKTKAFLEGEALHTSDHLLVNLPYQPD